jgi:ABC-type Na+ efflux pump permease subunit
MAPFGKILIIFGVALVVIGALFLLGDRLAWLRLGRLPGDFNWSNHSGTVRVYFPLMTMLLLSLLLSLILWLFRK